MLREIDLNYIKWDTPKEKTNDILEKVDNAIKIYGKVVLKEKTTQSGIFINIYVYDKKLYRNILIDSIKIS